MTFTEILLNPEILQLIKNFYECKPHSTIKFKVRTSINTFTIVTNYRNVLYLNNFKKFKLYSLSSRVQIDLELNYIKVQNINQSHNFLVETNNEGFKIKGVSGTTLAVCIPPKDSTKEEVLMQYNMQWSMFQYNPLHQDFLLDAIQFSIEFNKNFL